MDASYRGYLHNAGLQPVLVHLSKNAQGSFSFNPVSINFLVEVVKTTFAIGMLLLYVRFSAPFISAAYWSPQAAYSFAALTSCCALHVYCNNKFTVSACSLLAADAFQLMPFVQPVWLVFF